MRNAGGAKETSPRENQRVTKGDRQVPLCDLCGSFVLLSYETLRLQFLSKTDSGNGVQAAFFLDTETLKAYVQSLYGLKVIFPQAIVPGRLELRPFSPFAWNQELEELPQGVLHEK